MSTAAGSIKFQYLNQTTRSTTGFETGDYFSVVQSWFNELAGF
jgi:hypothetical protein